MAHEMPFRYRAHEVSRIEAFSDVIFGFALSLIVISLEVPKTYAALMETMRGILPFAFCFLIFIGLWWRAGILPAVLGRLARAPVAARRARRSASAGETPALHGEAAEI